MSLENILLLVGSLLLFVEIFVISGYIWAGLIGLSLVVMGFVKMFALGWVVMAFGLGFCLLLVVIKFLLRKSPLISYGAQEKQKQKIWKNEEGLVETDLKPSGYISVGQVKYQAVSNGSYIRKGEKVKILSQRGETLIVTKI